MPADAFFSPSKGMTAKRVPGTRRTAKRAKKRQMKKSDENEKESLALLRFPSIVLHMKNLLRFLKPTNRRRYSRIAYLGESMAAFNAPAATPPTPKCPPVPASMRPTPTLFSAGWHPAPRRDTAMPQDVC